MRCHAELLLVLAQGSTTMKASNMDVTARGMWCYAAHRCGRHGHASAFGLSVHEGAVPGAAQRRNPLALGHMANHPGKEDVPNVMIAAFDYDVPPGVGAAVQSSSILGPAKQAVMPGILGPALSVSLALY